MARINEQNHTRLKRGDFDELKIGNGEAVGEQTPSPTQYNGIEKEPVPKS